MTQPSQSIPAVHLEAVRAIHERFCRALEASVSAYLQAPAAARALGPGGGTEIEGAAETGAALFTLDLKPFRDRGFAWVTGGFARSALELLLGTGPDGTDLARPLTPIDLHILSDLFDIIFRELRTAWAPYCSCAFTPELSEPRTQPPVPDGLVHLGVEVSLGEATGVIGVALPSLLVRLVAQRQQQKAAAEASPAVRNRDLTDALKPALVRLDAVLHGGHLRFRDLLELKPGQVVLLPHPEGSPVECEINGKPKLEGEILSNGRGVAFSVSGWLPAEGRPPQSRQS